MRAFQEVEQPPITKARTAVRRLWFEFDRTLGRKYHLAAILRDPRLTPEDIHRITSVLAEINECLGDLDGQLNEAEDKARKLATESEGDMGIDQ
jgi:hypothetical protein